MIKLLKYIWLYLTDPFFRFYDGLYFQQEIIDRLKKEQEKKAGFELIRMYKELKNDRGDDSGKDENPLPVEKN